MLDAFGNFRIVFYAFDLEHFFASKIFVLVFRYCRISVGILGGLSPEVI